MRISSIVALFLLIALLGGWSVPLEEFWYKRTTKGVALCEAKGAGQGLNKLTVRNICVRKHQKEIQDSSIEGKAGYVTEGQVGSFRGYVRNKSTDVVVTKYSVWISHHNAPLTITEMAVEDQWIEPGHSDIFTIEKEKLAYEPKTDDDRKSGTFDWRARNIFGVKISF
jgi:hypothetical protein